MEGIPRVPMIAPEMKVPSQQFPEQLRPGIKEYIAMHYQDDPNKYDKTIDELEQMRSVISLCHADVESVCVAKRYYAQLAMMKKRFPMEEHDPIVVSFAWTDRTLDLMNQLVYEDINFEMCCIMFNIGVAHAQIAASETRTEVDSIKNAFVHFQWAAWPLQYLRDQMGASRYGTGDFESIYLTFYLNIFLAQAQECMLEKSMIDHRKPVVIARVALQINFMYKNCEAFLKASGISDLLSSSKYRELERLCNAKANLYGAIHNYYLGQHADDEKQSGIRLFYFARSLELIKMALQVAEKDKKKSLLEAVQFAYDVISQREANARKENEFVYHERIPLEDELPTYEGVSMVKPIGFDPCDSSVAGEDLFRELLPTDVVRTISLYSEEKSRYIREILDEVMKKDAELENYLLSMKLDQLGLDQPADQVRLPDELLQASAAFTAQPDLFPDLLDNFQKITSMATVAERKLTELKYRMRQITNSFFTGDEGYKAIWMKLDELRRHHEQASENNAELQRAMATHSENLKLLSMPLSDLTLQICGDFINPGESAEGQRLRQVANKVDEMRKQRCQLIERLRMDLEADDITKKALTERELDSGKLFESEFKKHDKNRELIEQNMRAQENIVRALTEANANFADYRQQIVATNERRALQSLTLVTAYQVFMDIVEKTQNALGFYGQMSKLLDALERGVKNMEEINQQAECEDERKRQAEEENRLKRLAMVEEQRRKLRAQLEAKKRKEEAEREAARALDEFRFN